MVFELPPTGGRSLCIRASDATLATGCAGKGGNQGTQYMLERGVQQLVEQGHSGDKSSILMVGDRYDTDIRGGSRHTWDSNISRHRQIVVTCPWLSVLSRSLTVNRFGCGSTHVPRPLRLPFHRGWSTLPRSPALPRQIRQQSTPATPSSRDRLFPHSTPAASAPSTVAIT